MTPLAMKIFRHLLHQAMETSVLVTWADTPCFELSEVSALIHQTGQELQQTLLFQDGQPLMEHGGLLLMPAQHVWLEYLGTPFGLHGRLGVRLDEVEDQICYLAMGPAVGDQQLSGFLELQPDGEHFIVRPDTRYAYTAEQHFLIGQIGGWAAAALLLINAPRGVERRDTPAHKTLAKEARKAGLGELRPFHTITLSKKPQAVGEETGQSSPKAFHFCRSHLRLLPSGGETKVRAHWRGDPSLGINQGNYRVVASAAEVAQGRARRTNH